MSGMSMNKVIHGAIRRDLDRFISALRSFSAGDTDRAQQLGTAWANFDDQLKHHHDGEHAIAWPAMEAVGVSRELLDAMDTEHDAMAAVLDQTRAAMDQLVRSPGKDQADTALKAFTTLRDVTVQHLEHEEAELEGVYLAKRETPELKAMAKAFSRVSPARGGRFVAWVLDDASPEERAAVSQEIPAAARAIIGGVFGRGYRRNVATVWRS
jgi:hemerythrin-like domain-containing protein